MLMKWILGKEETALRDSAIWNTVAGAISAGQTAILLVFIAHFADITIAGVITIAFALAGVFWSLGKYGVRTYQVTDVNARTDFADYFICRSITVGVSVLALGVYLLYMLYLGGYTLDKTLVVFLVTCMKLVEALEDVYLGCYQQVGRMDIAVKIMSVRLIVITTLMCVLVCFHVDMKLILLIGFLGSVLIDVFLIGNTFFVTEATHRQWEKSKVLQLLKVCFPLCLGTTLSIYIGNVPKYMIDAYMDETIQAIFGYIMMPVFVIMLLSQFIYQPFIKELGDIWSRQDLSLFRKKVMVQCFIIIALTLVVFIVGGWLGLPVLSVIYNVDLALYQKEFLVLLLGGGFYALATYLNVPITTIRKQKYIAFGYGLATILSLAFGQHFVIKQGMMGAAMLYLMINILLTVTYMCVLAFGVKKEEC